MHEIYRACHIHRLDRGLRWRASGSHHCKPRRADAGRSSQRGHRGGDHHRHDRRNDRQRAGQGQTAAGPACLTFITLITFIPLITFITRVA
ncbi:hypothetical protein [Duganella sp. CF517]|uniref:hypothetical protein n=1 Tax=Duganella sp. CF517 TaxID=1881038 RepID=UPI001E451A41|nr:hypothetical protein [Duganella sp. CF517]